MPGDLALRLRACERVHDAIDAIARLGPVSEVIEHAADAAAAAADLDRVLLSRIEDGALVVDQMHVRGGITPAIAARLDASRLRLAYPLIECELMRRRQARVVTDVDAAEPGRYAFVDVLCWRAYVAAPIVVDGTVVGFLHGDRGPERRALAALDAEALERFAAGFALVFERAVLRRRLREQRREIRRVATWAEERSSALSDGVIELCADRAAEDERRASAPEIVDDGGHMANLTAREVDVLKLMAEGKSNGDIARTLVVSEGTVKFHVKNILRKMQASNRSDASSRYLRLTLREGASSAASPIHR